jgi:hypothetical protein
MILFETKTKGSKYSIVVDYALTGDIRVTWYTHEHITGMSYFPQQDKTIAMHRVNQAIADSKKYDNINYFPEKWEESQA